MADGKLSLLGVPSAIFAPFDEVIYFFFLLDASVIVTGIIYVNMKNYFPIGIALYIDSGKCNYHAYSHPFFLL